MRLVLVAQVKKKNKKILNICYLWLSYLLCKIPASLSNLDGTIRKTDKSALIKLIEAAAPSCFEDTIITPSITALIIDGMALINNIIQLEFHPKDFATSQSYGHIHTHTHTEHKFNVSCSVSTQADQFLATW